MMKFNRIVIKSENIVTHFNKIVMQFNKIVTHFNKIAELPWAGTSLWFSLIVSSRRRYPLNLLAPDLDPLFICSSFRHL